MKARTRARHTLAALPLLAGTVFLGAPCRAQAYDDDFRIVSRTVNGADPVSFSWS
jgi:hypothetical protein